MSTGTSERPGSHGHIAFLTLSVSLQGKLNRFKGKLNDKSDLGISIFVEA